jgi:hypothetical protein
MSMFEFIAAALSLAPLGLFLLFWGIFPRDRVVYPIYRESGSEVHEEELGTQARKNEVVAWSTNGESNVEPR